MVSNNGDLITVVAGELHKAVAGQVHTDLPARILYSTDASIYQIEPFGVVFPRELDDLQAIVEICARYHVPVLARGAGSSLAGQAIGRAWIVDCSRHLDRLIEINPEDRTALLEPGVILNTLNNAAGRFNLQFGPDPASSERATIGGSIANNATGSHSICYGMAADHLLGVELVLADGSLAEFDEISLGEARRRAEDHVGLEASIYRIALEIRERWRLPIQENWPRTWRRASGYNLNYLLPWSPSTPPEWMRSGVGSMPYPPVTAGSLNLAPLIAGSEGTLGVIRRLKLRLVSKPAHSLLLVLAFSSIAEACDLVPQILEHAPSAVELIPQNLIRLARSVPAYASLVSILDPLFTKNAEPPALLVIEFSGSDHVQLHKQAIRLAGSLTGSKEFLLAETAEAQRQVWGIRKVGLGLFMSRAGDAKPWSFIEDLSVPVERLGTFVREFERLLAEYGVEGENYGHASAGCLHIRPVINLKSVGGVETLRKLAHDAVELTLGLGGAVSGEHGDGLARSIWNERMFGSKLVAAFRLLKQTADPSAILNPGKIVCSSSDAPLPSMADNLRFGGGYQSIGWHTVFDYSSQGSLVGAVEQCNGAGVCRKFDGVMCPSFQASREEMHSTRGRANLLRALISGKFPHAASAEQSVLEALDLCLACKGCKAECPSAVDMAKLKYEFINDYHTRHPRKLRDYLFGYIGTVGAISRPFWFLANPVLNNKLFMQIADRFLGLSGKRKFPNLACRPLKTEWKRIERQIGNQLAAEMAGSDAETSPETVLFLSDPFTEYFYPQVGLAALRLLRLAGCRVTILPVLGSGRTLISKGMLKPARHHARRLVQAVEKLDPQGKFPIVGVEPSEMLSLIDEYPDFFPNDGYLSTFSERVFSIEEFLVRCAENQPRIMRVVEQLHGFSREKSPLRVLLHGHCYQKARPPAADGFPVGVGASQAVLEAAGYQVEVVDSGCCGMAGSFGYESEHYQFSVQVGELALLPAIRSAEAGAIVAAPGVSCRSQIEDGTGKKALHPVELFFLNQ